MLAVNSSHHASTQNFLGIAGMVLYPSLILGQLIDLIDAQLFFDPSEDVSEKFGKIAAVLKQSFDGYPKHEKRPFTVVYCTRIGVGMKASFYLATLKWADDVWSQQIIGMPKQSDLLIALGSGAEKVTSRVEKWHKAQGQRTSRSIFSAFCDSLRAGEDPSVGGGPQLVGLYREGPAHHFGAIFGGDLFLLGLPAGSRSSLDEVEWRNELFELCDWRTKQKLTGAHAAMFGQKALERRGVSKGVGSLIR